MVLIALYIESFNLNFDGLQDYSCKSLTSEVAIEKNYSSRESSGLASCNVKQHHVQADNRSGTPMQLWRKHQQLWNTQHDTCIKNKCMYPNHEHHQQPPFYNALENLLACCPFRYLAVALLNPSSVRAAMGFLTEILAMLFLDLSGCRWYLRTLALLRGGKQTKHPVHSNLTLSKPKNWQTIGIMVDLRI